MEVKEKIDGVWVTVDYSEDCKKHKIYRCPVCFPDNWLNMLEKERYT